MMDISAGTVYQYHKGSLYRVLHLAKDANNQEWRDEVQVVYEPIAGGAVYVKSTSEFERSFHVA